MIGAIKDIPDVQPVQWQQEAASHTRDRRMIALVSDNLEAIATLCKEYRIRKLDLFGSAATGAFDPETSDVDFVVELGEYERGVARRYFDFADALEALLERKVDLVTEESIVNPYFRYSVDQAREPIYEAGDRQAVA